MADTNNLFGDLVNMATQFATPFVQRVVNTSSTPTDLAQERMRNNILNGSGANDPTLANQAPLGLLDFITGARTTGAMQQGTSSLRQPFNWTPLVIIAVAIVGVVVILKK